MLGYLENVDNRLIINVIFQQKYQMIPDPNFSTVKISFCQQIEFCGVWTANQTR